MPLDLSESLVIGISATALFDLSKADSNFRKKIKKDPDTAIEKYRNYMLKHENDPLDDGTGMPLVKALLNLNKYQILMIEQFHIQNQILLQIWKYL